MHGLTGLLEMAALLVGVAFLLVTLCARLGVPGLIGYILTGLLMGPGGFGLVAEGEALTTIGEIGVILLLFSLGLEFSFEKLVSLRRLILGVGAAQVLVTTGLVAAPTMMLGGLAPVPAVLVGGAVAMSSTALCLKVLASIDALATAHGKIAIAVLLFQDLAAIGFLLLHDATSGAGHGQGALTLFGGASALILALALARGPLQRLAGWVARLDDPELAQLLALAIALVAALGAVAAGLSPALAAFAAGMIIGEGDARHMVEREIRPFRDLFIGIFFIAIGAQLQLSILWSDGTTVLGWLAVLFVVKAVIAALVARMAGEPAGTSWRAGLVLAHGGEFSLMLVSVAMASGVMAAGIGQPLLLAIGISMIAASLLVRWVGRDPDEPAGAAVSGRG